MKITLKILEYLFKFAVVLAWISATIHLFSDPWTWKSVVTSGGLLILVLIIVMEIRDRIRRRMIRKVEDGLESASMELANAPTVTGKEDSTRLIEIICPHCHEDEWRVYPGLNYCEHTGAPFYVKVIPHDFENAGRGPKQEPK